MSLDAPLNSRQQVSAVPGQRTAASALKRSPRLYPQATQSNCKTAFPLMTAAPNILQNHAALHSLSRNTPAMPMAASAATHKLSGFFMTGHHDRQFFRMKSFRTPAIDIPTQLALTKQRGLITQNEGKAYCLLEVVAFFRFTPCTRPFHVPKDAGQDFRPITPCRPWASRPPG